MIQVPAMSAMGAAAFGAPVPVVPQAVNMPGIGASFHPMPFKYEVQSKHLTGVNEN